MKRFAPLLAAILTIVVVTPAFAWHITTEPGSRPVKVTSVDPRGDPLGRLVINNLRPAFGRVCVPDEPWAQDTVFSVGAKTAGRGECIRLRAGRAYEGTWSNSSEVERFTIVDVTPTANTRWWHKSKRLDRYVHHDYTTPRGCKTRTGWHRIVGGTWMSAVDLDTGHRHWRVRMEEDGWYQQPWRGYPIGTVC